VPRSLTDLAGLNVSAEDFLAAVLDAAAQPIWVVDPDGVIRFANPAALAALGYDSGDELVGRHSHETIHYQHPDGTPYPAADCPMLLPRTTGEVVTSDLDWVFRRDGSMFPVSYVSVPVGMREGRGAVVAFSDIEDRLRAETVLREHDAVLARQEASLRRVATLVAGGASSADVFAAIAREVAQVLDLPIVLILRYEPDGTATVLANWTDRPHRLDTGTRWPLDGPSVSARVRETGRPARIDNYGDLRSTIGDAVRESGMTSGAAAPILVDGDVWGSIATGQMDRGPLPDGIEYRLAELTELVATAISNTARRDELTRLADEQAALRRVATLVARESPSEDVFAAVARELGRLLRVEDARMYRYEPDGTATVVASWGALQSALPVGTRRSVEGMNIAGMVLRTGRPARIDDYGTATGSLAEFLRELGTRSGVGTPILVEGRVWGAMVVTSRQAEPLPPTTESRIRQFTDLVATAISNIQAREDLAASRARVVAAGDEERRRLVRDLHDGAQQRLVHTVITLKLARRALQQDQSAAPALVTEALDQAARATTELRELAHGILPAVLTDGGLRAGVQALSSRMPVPVENSVSVDRLPAAVEATAYFVVAEALTNVAKHARAGHAEVLASVEDGTLAVQVRDDGVGGVRPGGSGLLGLADRLAAAGGELRVESPTEGGTLIAADIPLPD
jgi:PAS domain S-box-containing protein